jgi:hypothetical protein
MRILIVPAFATDIGNFPVLANELWHRRHFAAAQAMAANHQVTEPIQQPVVHILLYNRRHWRIPVSGATNIGIDIHDLRQLSSI